MPRTDQGDGPSKRTLTDRLIRSLPPAPPGQRATIWDAVVPGFGVRVSDRKNGDGKAASVSFIVMRRLPGDKHPTRVTIGRYHPDALPLAKAREEARKALGQIAGGKKPREERRRQEREAAERRAATVEAFAEDFIADMQRRKLRNAREFEAIIRREFLGQKYEAGEWRNTRNPIWRSRPVADVAAQDAGRLIRGIMTRGGDPEPGHRRRKSGGPWAAHHALAIGKTMWGWALDSQLYPIESSPFERLRPKRLIGSKKPRQRILADDEIRLVWEAAEAVGGAYGDLVKLLMLTGQRLSQGSTMQRGEIDLGKCEWIAPAGKMKMDRAHVTPLSPAVVEILQARFDQSTHRNGYLFSTTGGERPFSGFSKAKMHLDEAIAKLRAKAVGREKPNEDDAILHWTLHDLRRTVRSGLPALGIADTVAEAILAHARPGIAGVYDLYSYLPEKRDALERWAARIAAIVNPPPVNVVPLPRGRRAQ